MVTRPGWLASATGRWWPKRLCADPAPTPEAPDPASNGQKGREAGRARTVLLGGVPTVLEGAADDPYFQNVKEHAAYFDGFAALLARHVDPDATVLDVGANIGLSTILLARAARRVIAYEPSPPNAEYLRRNLAANGIGNVEVRAAASSSAAGVLRFHVSAFGAGSHVVAAGHVSGESMSAVEVPAVALDDEGLPAVAFIKMDAEGHEPEVLAGARALLARDRPLIYTEINLWCLSAFAGHSLGALVKALWRAHEVFGPEKGGGLAPIPDGYQFLHDAIAYRKGVVDVVLRPRAGVALPALAEMTWPEAARAAARGARSDDPAG